jgi:hypothetical protein
VKSKPPRQIAPSPGPNRPSPQPLIPVALITAPRYRVRNEVYGVEFHDDMLFGEERIN